MQNPRMLRWFRSKSLKEKLNETKRVKINGVVFHVRKLSVPDHLAGAKVMHASYEKFQLGTQTDLEPSKKKIKEYYRDVILKGVVKPKLSPKPAEECGDDVSIEEVLSDWDMVEKLHDAILLETYGKKKMKQFASLAKD